MVIFIVQLLSMILVAACYASVGLGGGTAYLAVLSFGDIDPGAIRPMAWSLNIIVTTVGLRNYMKKGHFSLPFSWPFLIGGAVGGAAGARIPISPRAFQWLLAVTLFIIAVRMIQQSIGGRRVPAETKAIPWGLSLFIGLVIGVLSGLVGIGGGIVLGPVLLAFGWAGMKKVAALTSAYILISSAGALAAHFAGGGGIDAAKLAVFGVLCLIGGYLGSRYGAGRAAPARLMRIFSVLVLFASLRLGYNLFTV
ncbi:sulfite exporter TauE/SafE family protein [Acidobacteriota bacterium]